MATKNDRFVYPNAMLHTSRTKFPMRHMHKTSMYHGGLYPIDCIEVVPGDTFELKLADLIRMSNPIAPIMDNIEMHVAAYFVPLRLTWDGYEEFEGVNKTGAWYNSSYGSYVVPAIQTNDSVYNSENAKKVIPGSIFDMMGTGLIEFYGADASNLPSLLPFRAYYRIWNEHYRVPFVSAPLPINYGAVTSTGSGSIFVGRTLIDDFESGPEQASNSPFDASNCIFDPNYQEDCCTGIMKVAKFPDQFTKCLPAPQFGDSVSYIPNMIPVNAFTNTHVTQKVSLKWANVGSGNIDTTAGTLGNSSGGTVRNTTSVTGSATLTPMNLYTDMNKVSATVNDLRLLFQLQKYREKDARYGLRNIADKTLGHFGVRSPDATIQQSQYLGEANFRINVDQVLSTAGAADDATTKLGQPGANSVTGGNADLGTFSFTERGYIIIVAAARHTHTYGNGILPHLLHKELTDFYDPLFANIGEVPVKTTLIGATATELQRDLVFGYQECFWEYRFMQDRVSGILNPAANNSLDFWTLADDYSSTAPTLSPSFVYENRDSISRALVTGKNGVDYICDWYFMHTAVRPMPLFGIPGLVDHH